ncbi:MAG: hypothetical protein EKK62_03135 [Acidimicrobiia bacterium]|nr:MAG: hypothetical protein EKK62_03135 [Acidimicrobiia bacterium]
MADMTASDSPQKLAEGGPAGRIVLPDVVLKTDVQLYDGATVFQDPNDSMLAVSAGASGNPDWIPVGVAADKILGNGVLRPHLTRGPHVRKNSATSGETVPATLPRGWPLYAKDNQTVSLTDGGGLYPFLGWFGGMTGDSTPLPIVWIGFCPFALNELVITVQKGHADLTDADTTQDFTLYTLPGPAVVLGPPWVRSLTAFSGGGTGSATVAIGIDSDPDAIGDERDIFTGAAAAPAAMTAGVNGAAGYPLSAGGVIKATFVADTTVAAFTAGAVIISLRLKPGSY